MKVLFTTAIKYPMKRATILVLLLVFSFSVNETSAQHMSGKMRGGNRKQVIMPGLTINFNVLNVALYGPIVQLEAKLSGKSFLVPFIRYSYAGLASHYQWTNFEEDSKYDPSSIAAGIGYKHFMVLNNRKHYVYYGAFGEFLHEKGLHNIDPTTNYEYEQTRYALALYGNLGYRWNFRRTFYLSLGILPGVAFDIKNKGYYTTGASEGLEYGDFSKTTFTGMIDFSFGWKLMRGN